MTASMLATALLAASLSGSYDCAIERQVAITEEGAQNQEVMFPESDRDAWRFGLRIANAEASPVTIDWPANPIQIAGTHPTLPLAPGQVAFAAVARGPCMFTEQACITLVELSARDDGTTVFSILPAGSVRNEGRARSMLHVVFLGTCRRRS